MHAHQRQFFDAALACGALRFGQFTLKSGRQSPYFFNAGAFASGAELTALARAYVETLKPLSERFDLLYGPAYKGIPLVAAIATAAQADQGLNWAFAFNRKERKAHGEGGDVVGTPLRGRVMIVDDVVSAGTSVRESVDRIRAAGANVAGVCVALDRQERGEGEASAVQELSAKLEVPVVSIAGLDELIEFAQGHKLSLEDMQALRDYQALYGIPRS